MSLLKKKNLLIAGVAVLLFLAVIILVLQKSSQEKKNRVCFRNNCFFVELALTAQEKSQGLMFRRSLELEEGMLFIFEKEGKHRFWMKDTLIPLDIIWINEDQEVVFVSENTQPCQEGYPCSAIEPIKRAKYVLEINGGISKKIGLNLGDKLNIEYPK